MKTAEEILKNNTGHAHGLMDAMVIKSMKEFALEVAKEALKNADKRVGMFPNYRNLVQDKILNETNIPKL